MQIHTSDGRQDKAIEGKFNPFGKLYQLTVSPKGAESLTTKYTYSPTLEILTVTDPLGRTTRYTYDEIDRLTDVSKPDGSRQSIQYFDNANAKAITDENGNVTTYMYDGRNNLIQVRLPNYRPASYVYGALGNLLSVTDLRGMKTTFSYDSNANLVSTTFPDGTQESNTYDVLGNLLSHTDPNGQTTRYDTYDSQKRPKTVSFSDGTLVNYAYDAGFKGKVSAISVSGPDSQTLSYAYDPFGNIIKQTKSLGSETFTLEYLYDDSGLLLKQKDPLSGNWQEFSYDGMGRLTQIQFPINGGLRPVINEITYNKANLMLSYALPLSNITATQGFDPQNDRIKSIAFTGPTYLSYKNWQNSAIMHTMNPLNLPQFEKDPVVTGNALPYFTQTYTYDPAGNRTQMTQKEAADTTQFTYDYDRMNQLVAYAMKVNNADPVEFKYTYDSQGNRTSLTQGSTTLTTDFDTTTNKPNGYWFGAQKNDENHIEFVYDKNGNRTAKQLKTPKNELLLDITYGWNAQNRMTRYTLQNTTQTNHYQFSGPRYEKKETSPEGTETTRFYPDDILRLLSEKVTDAKGQKSYAYIYLGTQKLARISKNADTQKDEVSYFLNDALGTPAWITYEHTASPNAPVLISQNLRDPWGNEMGSTLFNQTPVRDFTGKQQDTLSNLYDFGFRYYDSLLGTWIGKDLVPPDYTSPLSLNEYLYALNSPLKYVDLDGRLTVYVHGTWSSTDQINRDFIQGVSNTFGESVYLHSWSGGNTKAARHAAASTLASYINNHAFSKDEKLNIVAHSHGGNVVKDMTQSFNLDKKIDTLTFLGTPNRDDYKLNLKDMAQNAKIVNVYDLNDKVQIHGGPWGTTAKQTIDEGMNFQINSNLGPIQSHSELHSLSEWNLFESYLK